MGVEELMREHKLTLYTNSFFCCSFEFKVLGKGFLTHVEHRKSASKVSWEEDNKKHKAVDRMYDDFMKVVYDALGNKPKVKLCHLL